MRTGPDAVRRAALAAGLLIAQQVAAKATRDALFLSNFDVATLPVMTAGAACVSLLAVFAFSRSLTALSPARLLPAALGAGGALFLAEWSLVPVAPRAAAVALYLHHAVLGAALLSGFWSAVNERFDPHAAKRAMGTIGAGAALGGALGGLLTWRAAALVEVPTMLLALAGTSLAGLASTRWLEPGAKPAAGPPAPSGPTASGLGLIRAVPFLTRLALLVGLGAFLEAVLDYLLGASAAASFARGAPLMSFFALFHSGAGLMAFALQAVLVRASLHRVGLAGTLALQPGFAAAGAGLALLFPRLASVVALRAGHAALRNSAFRSSYELLYTPLPVEQKRPAKVIVDVGCDRIGSVLGSGAVMLALKLAPASPRVLPALALGAAALALGLALRCHRAYVDALAASLRSGAVTLEASSIVDVTTLQTLASVRLVAPPGGAPEPDPLLRAIADLRSGDPARIRGVLEAPEIDPGLVHHLIPLLAHDALFDSVAASLRRAAPRGTGQLVDALLDDRVDPLVRRRIPRVLRGVPTQRAVDGLLLGLADERFDLRYRCGQALARLRAQSSGIALPRETILAAAGAAAEQAGESARQLEHVFTLLGLVLEREPLQLALRALRAEDQALRGTALEYLDNVVPGPVRDRLFRHLGAPPREARPARSPDELRDDLLRTRSALPPPEPQRRD